MLDFAHAHMTSLTYRVAVAPSVPSSVSKVEVVLGWCSFLPPKLEMGMYVDGSSLSFFLALCLYLNLCISVILLNVVPHHR